MNSLIDDILKWKFGWQTGLTPILAILTILIVIVVVTNFVLLVKQLFNKVFQRNNIQETIVDESLLE